MDFEHFRQRIGRVLEQERESFALSVPFADHLSNDSIALKRGYFVRHRIETVKRIVLTAPLDADALSWLLRTDYETARLWGQYTVEEMNHDKLFISDLTAMGVSPDLVRITEPLNATREMLIWLSEAVRIHGAMPMVAYSTFVEWNSQYCGKSVLDRVEGALGKAAVRGARSHAELDDALCHESEMMNILYRLFRGSSERLHPCPMLHQIGRLFRKYFTELYLATNGR